MSQQVRVNNDPPEMRNSERVIAATNSGTEPGVGNEGCLRCVLEYEYYSRAALWTWDFSA